VKAGRSDNGSTEERRPGARAEGGSRRPVAPVPWCGVGERGIGERGSRHRWWLIDIDISKHYGRRAAAAVRYRWWWGGQ
jgi:hypothetical protein